MWSYFMQGSVLASCAASFGGVSTSYSACQSVTSGTQFYWDLTQPSTGRRLSTVGSAQDLGCTH